MLSTNGLTIKQDQVRDNYSEEICLAVKYPLDNEPLKLILREFCRKMNGLADSPEVDILQAEMTLDCRKRYSLEFQKVPITSQRILRMGWNRNYSQKSSDLTVSMLTGCRLKKQGLPEVLLN